MNKTMDNNGKRREFGLFVLAASIYTTGVVAFSAWSYFQHRASLLAQADQALINATHATEQVIGGELLGRAMGTETIRGPGYVATKAKLGRIADNCRFDAIGAVGRKGAKTWLIIDGGGCSDTAPWDNALSPGALEAELSSHVKTLANSGNSLVRMQTVQMQTVRREKCRELRIAIRYHAISADTGYALVVARSTHNVNQLIRALTVRAVAIGLFLFAMAFPLAALYCRTRTKASQKTTELNTQLQQDVAKQKDREAELKDAIRDLERFNALAVGRETRIIELKAEVNTLLEQMKRKKRYNVDRVE